jgi:hypothetical protein
MSVAQILGHLRTGDVIIVRGAAASPRLRMLPATLGRPDAVDVNEITSRKLLRNLITVRKDGGRKK